MPTPRPDSRHDLLRRLGGGPKEGAGAGPRLTRLLINVTVQRSLGPVQVVVPPESTVVELIRAALAAYAREGRRPLLPGTDPAAFEVHYSQFSLESLSRDEKLMNLGSRNFFLCHKPRAAAAGDCRAVTQEGFLQAPACPLQIHQHLAQAVNTSSLPCIGK